MVFQDDIKPSGFIIYAACDGIYLQVHGPAFAASIASNKMNSHIHVIDPKARDLSFAATLRNRIEAQFGTKVTFSYEYSMIAQKYKIDVARTYYAINRFLNAPRLMDEDNANDLTGILVSDIDSLFMKHIPQPDYDWGLFLREPIEGTTGWEQEGTKVAAGIFYFNHETWWIADYVRQDLIKAWNAGNHAWFLDQVMLHAAYVGVMKYFEGPQGYIPKFHKFTADEMDWEFNEGTTIWTGKGPRKFENAKYLAMKKHFEDMVI